jgi:ubiquinone/menaquinone biosynthesis C-methylase UbiE
MSIKNAYNQWAAQYDSNVNKTRDLEALTLQKTLADITFENCLEIGCGTGKNTEWLVTKTEQVTAVDFSPEMLAKAKTKITTSKVNFVTADINSQWTFGKSHFSLVSFSLVLEHFKTLDFIFEQATLALKSGGYIYIGELHPFKQYNGSKPKFETPTGTEIVECYTHNISDFTTAAKKYNLSIVTINEFFDNDDKNEIPRILSLLLQKK